MCTAAQILANRSNARRSTGPLTPDGKARVSRNATKLGLFSTANFIRPEEQQVFEEFSSGYLAELSPATPLERTLAREIIHAAWRLRRCAAIESAPPEDAGFEELDSIQASVDRARTTASRTLHRALAELRRIRREAHSRPPGEALMNELHERYRRIIAAGASDSAKQTQSEPANSVSDARRTPPADSAKQSQPRLPRAASIARNAPCPCRSGGKYKRCCGKNAPPVLSACLPPKTGPGLMRHDNRRPA